jgi:hypothetical protein
MQKQYARLAFVGIFSLANIFLALPWANAANNEHKSKVTDYGDGIKMSEYKDKSGFEMDGGGTRFLFDRKTKTLLLIDANGAENVVDFSKPEADDSASKPVDLVADAK